MTRVLLLAGTAAAIFAAAVAATGGFDLRLAGIPIRSHSALPATIVAATCLVALLWRGPAAIRHELAFLWMFVERRASWIAFAIAILAVAFGAALGTYVAGGPDSYCYVNQAELLAAGRIHDYEPLAAKAPWPDRKWSFVPTGHVPAPGPDGAFVPMCAPGYPLIMAAARAAAGRAAMFWIVPVMGGLAVWFTFLLGRRFDRSTTGLFAAALLATSPTFLYQVVQPMTDVPAVALWTLALLVARHVARHFSAASAVARNSRSTILAGAATGAALMVRPNLVPLAAVTALIATSPPIANRIRTLVLFGAGALPFVAAIAWFNNSMYGGPLKSGYGDLNALFTAAHVLPNLARYPMWLLRTETPFVLLALAAPFVLPRTQRPNAWALIAFAAAAFACYLPYEVFNAWWYLRFVLPAFPPLLVLASAVFLLAVSRLTPHWRMAIASAAIFVLGALHLSTAAKGDAFRLRDFERRFRDGGEYVAQHLPPNAAIVTFMESGSVRYYSGRPTLVWTAVDPDWLDRALEYLRAQGLRPYLLFEGDEDQQFRKKFEGHSRIGAIDWPPIADINRRVWIYDPDDYERFRRGEHVSTQRVWVR